MWRILDFLLYHGVEGAIPILKRQTTLTLLIITNLMIKQFYEGRFIHYSCRGLLSEQPCVYKDFTMALDQSELRTQSCHVMIRD